MKIGDEVYVHGYVDEIRKDTVIIRNKGGYFGTSKKEVATKRDVTENIDGSQDMYRFKMDKYAVLAHGDLIDLIRRDSPNISISIARDFGRLR